MNLFQQCYAVKSTELAYCSGTAEKLSQTDNVNYTKLLKDLLTFHLFC